jgi:hypothetical protein
MLWLTQPASSCGKTLNCMKLATSEDTGREATVSEQGENMGSGALQDGQHRVRGLGASGDGMTVWGLDNMWVATGWRLQTVNVGFKGGAPLGSLTYAEVASGKACDVAVRWDHIHDQLQCFVTDRGTAQSERDILERDARARIGALLRISAELGWRFASGDISRNDIFKAAGLSPVIGS